MSKPREPVDETLKRDVGRETLSRAETDLVWAKIEHGVADAEPLREPSEGRHRATWDGHRVGLAAAIVAVAILVIAVGSLSPWNESEDSDSALSLTGLGSASAAEVLGFTADSARDLPSLVPGPGQAFFATEGNYFLPGKREMKFSPYLRAAPPGPFPRYEKEFWIGPDGKGAEIQKVPAMKEPGEEKITWVVDRFPFDVSTIGVDPEEGSEWWNGLTLSDLKELPAEPAEALKFVRDAEDRAVRKVGHWQAFMHGSAGKDMNVLLRTMSLLTLAPLTGEQRAALFEVILSAPDWYRADGRSTVAIENRGLAETVDGSAGIAIRVEVGADEKLRRKYRGTGLGIGAARYFDLIVDPEAGRFLELRGGVKGQPALSWVTYESLELRDLEEMPEPDPRW